MSIPYDDPAWFDRRRAWYPDRIYTASPEEKVTFNYAGQMADYIKHRDEYDVVVFYEDLVAEPQVTCRRLFEATGTPPEYVPRAIKALERDSQEGQFGKRGAYGRVVTREEFDKVNAMLRECDVPLSTEMSLEQFKKVICPSTERASNGRDLL